MLAVKAEFDWRTLFSPKFTRRGEILKIIVTIPMAETVNPPKSEAVWVALL
jgi:hypothetical protein